MKFSGMISIEGEDFESSLFLLNLPLLSENGKKKKRSKKPFLKSNGHPGNLQTEVNVLLSLCYRKNKPKEQIVHLP